MSGNRAIKLMQRRQKTVIVAPARMGAHRKTSLHGNEAQTCSPLRVRAADPVAAGEVARP